MRDEKERNIFYLGSIIDAIDAIESYRGSNASEPATFKACVFELMTIGEAVTQLSPDLKLKYPHVRWKSIAGMRHKIVHEYFRIDEQAVEAVIRDDLDDLRHDMEVILKEIGAYHG